MTDPMPISFHSTAKMDEHERNLMTGTLEQRKEAFKEDEELMRETTKFISEVIETATTEASKRKVHSEVTDSRQTKNFHTRQLPRFLLLTRLILVLLIVLEP